VVAAYVLFYRSGGDADITSATSYVITGLVPVIPIRRASRSSDRDGRAKPGHERQF
jgi:hypothetical protein